LSFSPSPSQFAPSRNKDDLSWLRGSRSRRSSGGSFSKDVELSNVAESSPGLLVPQDKSKLDAYVLKLKCVVDIPFLFVSTFGRTSTSCVQWQAAQVCVWPKSSRSGGNTYPSSLRAEVRGDNSPFTPPKRKPGWVTISPSPSPKTESERVG